MADVRVIIAVASARCLRGSKVDEGRGKERRKTSPHLEALEWPSGSPKEPGCYAAPARRDLHPPFSTATLASGACVRDRAWARRGAEGNPPPRTVDHGMPTEARESGAPGLSGQAGQPPGAPEPIWSANSIAGQSRRRGGSKGKRGPAVNKRAFRLVARPRGGRMGRRGGAGARGRGGVGASGRRGVGGSRGCCD